jgi:transposase
MKHMGRSFVRGSCWRRTSIPTGPISVLPKKQDAQTATCANGDVAGWIPEAWKSCPDLELPGVFPSEVRAEATALACSLPREKGCALSRWSLGEIAKQLVTLEWVTQIAISTVGRWLAAEKLKPWRYRSWQHILNPQLFLERARPVLQAYEKAREWLAQGIWVVCVDEKTSIQAREREQVTQPAVAGEPMHVSPRYKRRGALNLFAGLSVADGQKYGQTHQRKRFVDFQAFLLQVVIPEALRRGVHTLKLILDNGPTHAPKQLERWLQEQVRLNGWTLTIEVLWLPTNASWLDQIEIWFSVLQRKLLQPNDFTSLDELAKAIMEFVRCDNQTAKPIHWTYTVDKLEKKLGTI